MRTEGVADCNARPYALHAICVMMYWLCGACYYVNISIVMMYVMVCVLHATPHIIVRLARQWYTHSPVHFAGGAGGYNSTVGCRRASMCQKSWPPSGALREMFSPA